MGTDSDWLRRDKDPKPTEKTNISNAELPRTLVELFSGCCLVNGFIYILIPRIMITLVILGILYFF